MVHVIGKRSKMFDSARVMEPQTRVEGSNEDPSISGIQNHGLPGSRMVDVAAAFKQACPIAPTGRVWVLPPALFKPRKAQLSRGAVWCVGWLRSRSPLSEKGWQRAGLRQRSEQSFGVP